MSIQPLHWKPLATAGAASGLVQIATGVIMYAAGLYFAPWIAPLSLTLLAVCIVIGTRWYVNRTMGGRSSYVTALLIGVFIAVSTAFLYAVYNVVSMSFFYPDFLEQMAQATGLRTTMGAVIANNARAFCVVGTAASAVLAPLTRGRRRNAGGEQ